MTDPTTPSEEGGAPPPSAEGESPPPSGAPPASGPEPEPSAVASDHAPELPADAGAAATDAAGSSPAAGTAAAALAETEADTAAAGEVEPPLPETRESRAATAAARVPVRRHHWIVRVTHWVNTVVLIGMVASGLQIYDAYPRFGIRGTRLPLPNPLDSHAVPRWARLGGWLAGGLNWHFFLMWPLVLNGLLYLGYLVVSGEWRSLLFRPRDVGPAIEMQKYYLHLRREHPPQGKHNALQKGAYSFIVVLGMVSVLTGLALWKPVQLWWLTGLFGGYELARYWHFVAVWLFVAFIVVHVVLVFAVDVASLPAMITGWYRGRFPSHD
ncbi:MAG TPA: cytochrome b/b6 domain-containing protein [Gemmatimonadales bacterium]|nr:cytochrome b/b6 domain-containing protein [Gemmatimonadales bacterium]